MVKLAQSRLPSPLTSSVMHHGDFVKTSYNIPEMEAALENATSVVLGEIKEQFRNYLSGLKESGLNRDALKRITQLAVCDLSDHSSLKTIYSMQGFYVICTDHEVADNSCTFSLECGQAAIYRGECSSVRRRIESHLFNSTYQNLYEQRKRDKLSRGGKFSEPYYGACLKVDPTVSGINIDSEPYKNSEWSVIVLKMQGSSSLVRKQTELAFDALFGKPVASRE